jgi:hypothetical protein
MRASFLVLLRACGQSLARRRFFEAGNQLTIDAPRRHFSPAAP